MVFDLSVEQQIPFFVRPHEIDLFPNNPNNEGVSATVCRVQLAGSIAKIELMDSQKREIFVEMSHEKYQEHRFTTGEVVLAVPKKTVIFDKDRADYSI